MTVAREPWFADLVAERCRQQARDLERQARHFRALADKVKSPPEGVIVEYNGRDTLRFVGPPVAANSHSESGA